MWAKFCLLTIFINKVLLEHKHDHFFIVYGCFCATMVELSSYNGPCCLCGLKYLLSGPLRKMFEGDWWEECNRQAWGDSLTTGVFPVTQCPGACKILGECLMHLFVQWILRICFACWAKRMDSLKISLTMFKVFKGSEWPFHPICPELEMASPYFVFNMNNQNKL